MGSECMYLNISGRTYLLFLGRVCGFESYLFIYLHISHEKVIKVRDEFSQVKLQPEPVATLTVAEWRKRYLSTSMLSMVGLRESILRNAINLQRTSHISVENVWLSLDFVPF